MCLSNHGARDVERRDIATSCCCRELSWRCQISVAPARSLRARTTFQAAVTIKLQTVQTSTLPRHHLDITSRCLEQVEFTSAHIEHNSPTSTVYNYVIVWDGLGKPAAMMRCPRLYSLHHKAEPSRHIKSSLAYFSAFPSSLDFILIVFLAAIARSRLSLRSYLGLPRRGFSLLFSSFVPSTSSLFLMENRNAAS
jgi:hypothetical protein